MRAAVAVAVLTAGLCALSTAGAAAAWAQGIPSQLGSEMTAEEARREAAMLGIDLSDPEEAVRQARALGVPESRIQQWQRALAREQAPAPSARSMGTGQQRQAGGAEMYRPDQARSTGTGPQAQALAPPPALAGLPSITPGVVTLDAEVEAVSVILTLQNAETSSDRDSTFGTGDVGAGDTVQGATGTGVQPQRTSPAAAQGSVGSGVSSLDLYFVSASGTDTLRAERVQRLPGSGSQELWLGTFFVPPQTAPGLWTLTLEALDRSARRSKIDPAGVLRIEGTRSQALSHFGYEIFQNVPEAFQPGADGPVGDNYIVGPQDELRLTVWGDAEFQYDLPVDAEGRIYVPRAGQLTVAGKRLDELRGDVRMWLSRSYSGLGGDPPSAFLDLTVTRLRPIQVFVLGEVAQPGGYTIPSGSSIFNALYSVGGPTERGSLRNVQVIRGDRVATVDMYNYLLRGYDAQAVQLQTGDNIFIPPRGKTVSVEGAVRRPAIYELKSDEGIERLLAFAGGLEAEAYTKRFQVERVVPFEERRDPADARTVIDYDLTDVLAGRREITLADVDRVTIFSIPEAARLAAWSKVPAVSVEGAVFRPGRYELNGAVRTVRDLLEEADGLTSDAFREKAELIRFTADLEREIISLDLNQVMADVPTHNLVLRPLDSLYVASLQDLRGSRTVRISGQVRRPGEYAFLEGMTVADLLFQGGGLRDPEFLKEVFLERADLFRQSPDGRTEQIMPFDLAEALEGRGLALEQLLPRDEIRIYAAEVEVLRNRFVTISGAVKRPGQYRYRDGMTVEDLILQAGGFREGAYTGEVEVTRAVVSAEGEGERATQLNVPIASDFTLTSSAVVTDVESLADKDVAQVPAAADRFALQHRDRIYVRALPNYKEQETVTVSGEVRFAGEYTLLHQNETLTSVLRRAGGVLPTGYAKGGRLLRNGQQVIVEMDRALQGEARADVILQPGDEIRIPPQPNSVAVRGNVANEGLIKYVPGRRVSYYLNRAGGLQENTQYVLLSQASGATYKLRKPLFGLLPRKNPVVEDGAEIRVTVKLPQEDRPRLDLGNTLTDALAIATSTVTLLVLIRQLDR